MNTSQEDEVSVMEYSERVIYDIQDFFNKKLGGGYGTLKKAMEIEDFLYKDALHQMKMKNDKLWESPSSLEFYKSSVERLMKLMNDRNDKETDWVKFFNMKDVKNFRQQLTRAIHNVTKKKKKPVNVHSIPAPNSSGKQLVMGGGGAVNNNKKKKTTNKKTKKEKRLEEEMRKRKFQQEWEAQFHAESPKLLFNENKSSTSNEKKKKRIISPKPSPKYYSPKNEETKIENFPEIAQLMHQDSTSSIDGIFANSNSNEFEMDTDTNLFHDDDSVFTAPTLVNASDWGANSNSIDNNATENDMLPTTSAWSTAKNERKSQIEQQELKQKHQSWVSEERRRSYEENIKGPSQQSDSSQATSAEEELRLAREREREKRNRELQSQDVFMDGDHEALFDMS